jgi:hypothetical protein
MVSSDIGPPDYFYLLFILCYLMVLSVMRLVLVDGIMNWKDLKGRNRGLIEVLSQHVLGGIE